MLIMMRLPWRILVAKAHKGGAANRPLGECRGPEPLAGCGGCPPHDPLGVGGYSKLRRSGDLDG